MTADTSTATTRAHLDATAVVNCPVPLPNSTTVDNGPMPKGLTGGDLLLYFGILLVVVSGYVRGIKILPSSGCNLVKEPTGNRVRMRGSSHMLIVSGAACACRTPGV